MRASTTSKIQEKLRKIHPEARWWARRDLNLIPSPHAGA
ncbi:hypothetical protein P186_2516 [Pyrobaculum ferrireducens]|uniref:Uncharacterized protein n=1 Tax=Pyrobaculum ferrireducens TaxID=1104324 RepID=G7VD23_9CREN|nr:hypothetical protein P186_2516 [Pyrobaculum ferrireducens]